MSYREEAFVSCGHHPFDNRFHYDCMACLISTIENLCDLLDQRADVPPEWLPS